MLITNAQGQLITKNVISGNGVTAKVDGVSVVAGNAKLMKRMGVEHIPTICLSLQNYDVPPQLQKLPASWFPFYQKPHTLSGKIYSI